MGVNLIVATAYELKKKLKNQRPSAEVAPAPSRGPPDTLSSAGGR